MKLTKSINDNGTVYISDDKNTIAEIDYNGRVSKITIENPDSNKRCSFICQYNSNTGEPSGMWIVQEDNQSDSSSVNYSRLRSYHGDFNSPESLFPGSFVYQLSRIKELICDTNNKMYKYSPEAGLFFDGKKPMPPNGIFRMGLMDDMWDLAHSVNNACEINCQEVDINDIQLDSEVLDPEAEKAIYIDEKNKVVPGIIFIELPTVGKETVRRLQIVVPMGYVLEHSHALGDNPDGELLALLGAISIIDDCKAKAAPEPHKSVEVAAADSPHSDKNGTRITSHSIPARDRGIQVWLACKKPNEEIQEGETSKNWGELATEEGCKKYWESNGVDAVVLDNGVLMLKDIPSGNKVFCYIKDKKLEMSLFNPNGQLRGTATYDLEERKLTIPTNSQVKEYDIGKIMNNAKDKAGQDVGPEM